MTGEAFEALFTRKALRPFQPRPGTNGLTPMVEVHTPTEVLVFVLALDGFNDWQQRRSYLAGIGHRCASDGHTITACRFGSEAWTREFTAAEHAARGDRLIETYPDREEAIIVMGQTATGETRTAHARLYRRDSGKVERLGAWKIDANTRMRSPLLEAFWRGYGLEPHQEREAP